MSPSRSKSSGTVNEAAPVFAALGDDTRLGLLRRLAAEGPLSITQLSEGTGVTRQAITRHLHTLGDAGLIRDRRRGRERLWELDPEQLKGTRIALDRIAMQWDDALDRLRTLVEDE